MGKQEDKALRLGEEPRTQASVSLGRRGRYSLTSARSRFQLSSRACI